MYLLEFSDKLDDRENNQPILLRGNQKCMKIYQNLYLVIFYFVNKYLSFSLVSRLTDMIFGLSKLFIFACLFKFLGIRLGYVFFIFVFFFIFDIVVIDKRTNYNRNNAEYYYNKLEHKKVYSKFLGIYLFLSILCAIFFFKNIL